MFTIADDSQNSLQQEPSAPTQDARETELAVSVPAGGLKVEEGQVATGNRYYNILSLGHIICTSKDRFGK